MIKSRSISPPITSLNLPKGGLSYWVGAARKIGPTTEDWERRRTAPIVYLLKVGSDAVHERLYYVLACVLNLPPTTRLLGSHSPHHDLIAAAIQFEQGAFYPKKSMFPQKPHGIAASVILFQRRRFLAS
jgi:hypothetical protein